MNSSPAIVAEDIMVKTTVCLVCIAPNILLLSVDNWSALLTNENKHYSIIHHGKDLHLNNCAQCLGALRSIDGIDPA